MIIINNIMNNIYYNQKSSLGNNFYMKTKIKIKFEDIEKIVFIYLENIELYTF